MKLFALALLMLCLSASLMAQKKVNLEVTWIYTNVLEGYDHNCKTKIFIDGNEAGESKVGLESVKNKLVVAVEPGKHQVRIVNYAEYEGNWEEHTIANNYSVDAVYEDSIVFKKKPRKVSLIFDITTETAEVKVK
ncbi:MAG: hypothetical protein RI883_2633 [Bacteroidota bacterium]|jgi:hypothetical protein